MIELQQLRQLVAVWEAGSLSAAAEGLRISQPSLSRSMQRLEAELGLQLFDRGKNRLAFRPLGLRAVEDARRVLQEAASFEENLREYAERLSIVRIGANSPAPLWLLTTILNERFPGVVVAAEQKELDLLVAGLRDGHYRLILSNEPVEDEEILCRKYLEERLMLDFPANHPLSNRSAMEVKDLEGLTVLTYRHIGLWMERLDRIKGLHRIEQTELDVLEDLAVSSQIPVLTTSLRPTPVAGFVGRASLPILGETAQITFYLCGHKRDRALFERIF